MSERRNLIKNLFSLGVIQIANFAMPLISFPIISRIIGPEKFGIIQYANAFVAYFNVFIGYGFNLTATRRVVRNPGNKQLMNEVFSEVFFCQLILFFISSVCLFAITFTVPALAADKKIAFCSFIFCISSLLTQNWVFQAMQDLSKVMVLNLSGKVIYLIMVLSIINNDHLYYWQPLSLSITQILVGVCSFLWVKKIYHIRLLTVSISKCLHILWSEKHVFFSLIFSSMYVTANIIVLGLLKRQIEVGYFTASQRLISICLQVLTLPLAQVLYPFIGKAFGHSREKGIETAQKIFPVIVTVSLLMSLGIFLLADPVLTIFYGSKFQDSIKIFKILSFIPFISCINNMIGIQFMLNLKMDSLYFRIMSIATLSSIAINFLMTYMWDYQGTAFAWLITEVLIFVLLYLNITKKGITVFHSDYFSKTYFRNLKLTFSKKYNKP
ncbi:MAG TPA: flippase [Parafilimonas sp.]|nr:flippase [Parafilimonas sp.]